MKAEQDNSNKLHLAIGEAIPNNVPNEFSEVAFYIRDENNNLNLYADIKLPYLINHVEFLDYIDDPRYIFMENFDEINNSCRYICMIKPLGKMKGVYRLLNGYPFKIGQINVLYDLQNQAKKYKLVKNRQ